MTAPGTPDKKRKASDVKIDLPIYRWAPPHKNTPALPAPTKKMLKEAKSWFATRDSNWWMTQAYIDKLPPRRRVRTRFTYRQFLNLLWQNSDLYIVAQISVAERMSPAKVHGDETMQHKISALRKDIKPLRQFCKLVLGGGPESVWVGKPLVPGDVHNDCVSFYAGGKPGFDAGIVSASSTVWEMYDNDKLSVEDYTEIKDRKDLPYLEEHAESSKKLVRRLNNTENLLTRADHDVVREFMDDGVFDSVGSELAKKIRDPLAEADTAILDPATGKLKHVRCNFVYTQEILDAPGAGKYGVEAGSQCPNPAVHGTIRCELHGGLYASPEETRRLVISSQMKMYGLTDLAVSTIADIMMHGTTEASRLRAAETVLNRGGITEGADFDVPSVDGSRTKNGQDATDRIKDRLKKLANVTDDDLERIRAERQEAHERAVEGQQDEAKKATEAVENGEPDDGIVEGEIVEDE